MRENEGIVDFTFRYWAGTKELHEKGTLSRDVLFSLYYSKIPPKFQEALGRFQTCPHVSEITATLHEALRGLVGSKAELKGEAYDAKEGILYPILKNKMEGGSKVQATPSEILEPPRVYPTQAELPLPPTQVKTDHEKYPRERQHNGENRYFDRKQHRERRERRGEKPYFRKGPRDPPYTQKPFFGKGFGH